MHTRVSVAANEQRSVVDALLHAIALVSVVIGSIGIGAGVAAARAGSSSSARSTSPLAPAGVRHEYGALPLSFEANVGQASAGVQFMARGATYSAAFESNAVVLAPRDGGTPVTMRLDGAAAHPAITGGNRLPGVVNYLIGRNRAAWHTNVPTFADVTYGDVYPGIDMVWHGSQGAPEYDFVVAPGADPAAIHLSFAGAKGMSIDSKTGDLVVSVPNGTMRQQAPHIFQNEHGGHRSVPGRFAIAGSGTVGFTVGPYDDSHPLIMDPTLAYSTYLGGSLDDAAQSIAVDGSGDAYVAGSNCSANFPTKNSVQSTYAGPCTNLIYQPPAGGFSTFGAAFVSKLNAQGTALLYSTYIGGSAPSAAYSIAVDTSGDAFIAGDTTATDFPTTTNAFMTACPAGQQRTFATELSAAGSSLAYSTCLGTGGDNRGVAIAVHGGHMYLAGYTSDPTFPVTANAFQTTATHASHAFITVINPAGSGAADLVYSTYLGGSYAEIPFYPIGDIGIAVDTAGLVYVAGETSSPDFPVTPGAFQPALADSPTDPNYPTSDAFVTKLDPGGSGHADLLYSTFLGGFPSTPPGFNGVASYGADGATGIALGPPMAGGTVPTIYITGVTLSPSFPLTSGAIQNPQPPFFGDTGSYSFLSKLNPVGGASGDLVYSTFLGVNGTRTDLDGIAVDPVNGDAVVAGATLGSSYPTANAIQAVCGCFTSLADDAIVSEIRPDPTGTPSTNLLFSTYLGGTGDDSAVGVAVDNSGSMYVAGGTSGTVGPTGSRKVPSQPFPITAGAFQTTFGGGSVTGIYPYDAFVSKIAFADTSASLSVSPNPATLSQALTYTVTATNSGPSAVTIMATDAIPKGLKLQSMGAGCTSGTVSRVLTVTCVMGPIAPGASAQTTITLKAGKPGGYINTVSEDGNAVDLTAADNTATVTATVTR